MPDPRPFWLRFRQEGKDSGSILYDLEVREPPVDVYDLAKALQVAVHDVEDPGWEGAVQFDETQAHIWVRAEAPLLRRRFTVAYELGRIMLNPFGEYRDAAPGVGNTDEEMRAAAFGLCLLMPKVNLYPLVYESSMKIGQMAQVFGVRVNHMVLRIERMLNAGEEF